MTQRMLIDDTQPEETRVVVVNGNKLEDVEFESSSRKQIKGNVYLAKVMRIEPSLQAAFVDYGGNRHGFLAFGEIHPDYYHVDDKTMAELEKEVDTMIENKKQAIKEREQERARIREEKALKRAQRLEQEAAEARAREEAAKAAAENGTEAEARPATAAEQTEASNTASAATAEETPTAAIVENGGAETGEAPAAAAEEAEEKASDGENQAADGKQADKKKKAGTTGRRRGRKPKAAGETAETGAKDTSAAAGETASAEAPAETAAASAEEAKDDGKKKEEVKTLAESAGTANERIVEKDEECENNGENETEETGGAGMDNGSDDEVAADDDDDGEYDFEIQKKLILMRKLFHQSKIQDVIKEGQILLVQVVKEERGNKGAALTTYLSLAGRYCVLMPKRIKSGGVSRKITNVSDRKRLKTIIRELPISSDMSLIVRTAGEEKTKSDIVRDYNYLIRTWEQIRLDSLKSGAPALIYEEGNLIKRALRDMFTKEISEIIIDGNNAYQAARSFMKILSPHSMKKLKSCKPNDIPLFQRFQVEGQLDKLHDTNVQLESGGYLVINPTEALVSIDVNSGRATKEKDLEETALKTNLEAADEIAKQLRMRNLAGLVVIDFIDMDEPKNNQAIEKRMKEAMKKDRARVQIGKMSCFGLLEISRQRMHSSFFESNYQTCPHCHGRGIVRTIESGAVSILRTIEEEGIKGRSSKITVSLPRDVAVYLLNQKRAELVNIEQRYKMQVVICADDSVRNIADFKIERIKAIKPAGEETAKENKISEYEENDAGDETDTEETTAENAAENETEADAGENENAGFRRRGGRRDRRGRFDRRRGSRRRSGEPSGETEEKPAKEEAVILYNSHETPAPANTNTENEEKPEKRKVAWWKKLING